MGFSLKSAFKNIVNPLGMLGDFGGADPGKKQYAQMMGVYNQAKSQQALQFARAQAEQQKALGSIKTGFGAARKNTAQVFANSKRGAQEMGQQGLAASQQSMVDRGLYNTTVFDNAQRGVNADITRTLADIDAAYAQGLSELDVGQGQAEAAAYGGMSNLFQNQSAQQTALSGDIAHGIASIQYEDPNAWLNNLLGLGGMALGYGMFGPGGGGGNKKTGGGGYGSYPGWTT